jgi:probable rRNA maturation factor
LKFNIFSENIYPDWEINERKFINIAKRLLRYFLEVRGQELEGGGVLASNCQPLSYSVVSFDILYCGSDKTHAINREYRGKDYPADIITFAIFADTEPENRFVFDGEINLGEIIIALDKVVEEAQKKGKTPEDELIWLISHGILHLLGFDHQTEEEYNFVVELQNEAVGMIKK